MSSRETRARRAFDEAWATIAPSVATDPQTIDETRLKLAEAVLAVTGPDSTNVHQIRALALQIRDWRRSWPARVLRVTRASDERA
jgi:hypothetical protein